MIGYTNITSSLARVPRGDTFARTRKEPRQVMLFAVVLLVPFSYVPHELLSSGPNVALLLLPAIIALGFRYRIYRVRWVAAECWAAALATWILLRLTILSSLASDGETFSAYSTIREIAPMLAGTVVFRVARVPGTRRCIVSALALGFLAMLLIELYQLRVGLGRLASLAYVTPQFNYYTAGGDYRPFGTFYSPTVFAPFLAMVGAALTFAARGKRSAIYLAATIAGLAATLTRAAWIAFSVGIVVGGLTLSPVIRARALKAAVPILLLGALITVLQPSLASDLLARLDTLTTADYASNVTRLTLWKGVIQAVSTMPLIGFGSQPFEVVLQPFAGDAALLGHAHNNYLETLYLYGLVGAALFIGLLIAMVRQVRRGQQGDVDSPVWRAASIAALSVFIADSLFETTWGSFNSLCLVFLLTGLGSTQLVSRPSGTDGARPHRDGAQALRQPTNIAARRTPVVHGRPEGVSPADLP